MTIKQDSFNVTEGYLKQRLKMNDSLDGNLISSDNWVETPAGSTTDKYPEGWRSINGQHSENSIIVGEDFKGDKRLLWHSESSGDGGADGGFNAGGGIVAVDVSHTYRISAWMRNGGTDAGRDYLGLVAHTGSGGNNGVLNRSGLTNNTNAYVYANDLSLAGQWRLVVGYISPLGTGSSIKIAGGIWSHGNPNRERPATGSFVFKPGTAGLSLRAYQYYKTSAGEVMELCQPRIDDMSDPNTPSLLDLVFEGL